MNTQRIYRMLFSSVYPLYLAKVERKGKTKEEVDTIIKWLIGYDQKTLEKQLEKQVDFEAFFKEAPQLNPNRILITGVICGYRVENIEDVLIRNVRYLDKLIDELAKGKVLDKIFRK